MKKKDRIRLLAGLMALSLLTACGGGKSGGTEAQQPAEGPQTAAEQPAETPQAAVSVGLRETMDSLSAGEKELGLEGRYASVAEIEDGSLDSELLGTWLNESQTIVFDKDGKMTVTTGDEDTVETSYTCLSVDGRNILCTEIESYSYSEEGEETPLGKDLIYNCYRVEEGTLYMVAVDRIDPEWPSSSSYQSLQMFSRSDNGAVQGKPLPLSAVAGRWTNDNGVVLTIDENGISVGGVVCPAAFDEIGRLTVERDGTSTAYGFGLGRVEQYADDARTEVESKEYMITLSYTGADENDTPNLADCLDNWHEDFGWNEWFYAGSFSDSPTKQPLTPEQIAQNEATVASLETVGDAMALDAYERGTAYNEDTFIYAFELGGANYRAVAPLSEETANALLELDMSDEQYEQKRDALVSSLKLESVVDLDAGAPRQEELDALVGKSGAELLDDEWYCSGWDLNTMDFYMEHGPYAFRIVFDGTVESPEDFGDEDIRQLTVVSVEYAGIGDATRLP